MNTEHATDVLMNWFSRGGRVHDRDSVELLVRIVERALKEPIDEVHETEDGME